MAPDPPDAAFALAQRTAAALTDPSERAELLAQLAGALALSGRNGEARRAIDDARALTDRVAPARRDALRETIAAALARLGDAAAVARTLAPRPIPPVLRAALGDDAGAIDALRAVPAAQRPPLRLLTLLAIAQSRLRRRDPSGAAEAAAAVADAVPGLHPSTVRERRALALRAATLLYRTGQTWRARVLWRQWEPSEPMERLALAETQASLGAMDDARALWTSLEGDIGLRLPFALSRARFGGSVPVDALAAARAACHGDAGTLSSLAMTCTNAGFFAEAEKTIQAIADPVQRLAAQRRVALRAVERVLAEGV